MATPGQPAACTAAPPSELASSLRIGVDLTRVEDVAASLRRFGPRYARKIFTDAEIAETNGGAQAARLAARFAAKEAAIKALSPIENPPSWRSIEVRRMPGGACELVFYDRALEIAAAAGLDAWSLSMCHEGPVAVAVVAATGARPLPPTPPPSQEINHDG